MGQAAAHVLRSAAVSGQGVSHDNGRLLGLAIVMFVPATFWTLLLAGLANLVDAEITRLTLGLTFIGIATFLGAIFASLAAPSRGQ